MTAQKNSSNSQYGSSGAATEKEPILGLFLRVYWMILGYFPVLIFSGLILEKKDALFSAADAFFVAAVLAILVTRYIDIKYFYGHTADGAPATLTNLRRHVVILVPAMAAIRVVLQLLK